MDIHTERLILRPIDMQWKEEIFREFTPEIATFMTPLPHRDISETEVFIGSSKGKMSDGQELVYVILDKTNDEFLGCAGLHKIKTPHPYLGVWLKKSAHGKKFGREAMTALKKWADDHLEYEYLSYPVDRDNVASRKIPESLGGVVAREFQDERNGKILNTLEYRIFSDLR